MATSTPANANSPANISPVGPPPTITTACPDVCICHSVGSLPGRAFYGMSRVLTQAGCELHIRAGETGIPLSMRDRRHGPTDRSSADLLQRRALAGNKERTD